MSRYDHLLYASSSQIKQAFYDRYGHVSEIDLESSEELSTTVSGRLGALVASLRGDLSGGISKSSIKKINFDDELFQAKKVINDLLEEDQIPRVSELYRSGDEWNDLYRFSTSTILHPDSGEFDDEKNLVEVYGAEGNVTFHGTTSLDNWGSRSNVLQAIRASRDNDTYPLQGVLTPVSREFGGIEEEVYRVQYLFICAPDKESMAEWNKRQRVKRERLEG